VLCAVAVAVNNEIGTIQDIAGRRDLLGRNGRHHLIGMFRQSVFGRLAGYEVERRRAFAA
jgi:hypothetical protein